MRRLAVHRGRKEIPRFFGVTRQAVLLGRLIEVLYGSPEWGAFYAVKGGNPRVGSGLFLFILRTVTGVLCPVLEVAAGQFWNSFPLKISKG